MAKLNFLNVRRSREKPIFYGWWIVATGLLGITVKQGSFNKNFTMYVPLLTKELGIGVAAISFADMLGRMTAGFMAPLWGYLTDKFGYRNMLIFGGLTSGLGFILLARVNSYFTFTLVLVGLISLGVRAGYNNASIPAINAWFRKHKGLAMSIVSTGNGIGGLFAPLVGFMILSLGWRRSAFVTGLFIIAIMSTSSWIVRQSPESMGLHPDGEDPDDVEDSSIITTEPDNRVVQRDFSVREAMTTFAYWQLVIAVGFRNTVHAGIAFLMAPVMIWFLQGGGRDETESYIIAGFFMLIFSLGTLFLNPMVGWIGDRWHKNRVSALCMITGALSILALLDHSGSLWKLAIFALMLSLADAANPLAWAILGDFFGRKNFATLRGWQHLPDQLMSMSTPVWMGLIYDKTESYYWALILCIMIYILAAGSYWTLKAPKLPGTS
ncbi:MAG: MFS transporter [Dehalococcoidia bacterium]